MREPVADGQPPFPPLRVARRPHHKSGGGRCAYISLPAPADIHKRPDGAFEPPGRSLPLVPHAWIPAGPKRFTPSFDAMFPKGSNSAEVSTQPRVSTAIKLAPSQWLVGHSKPIGIFKAHIGQDELPADLLSVQPDCQLVRWSRLTRRMSKGWIARLNHRPPASANWRALTRAAHPYSAEGHQRWRSCRHTSTRAAPRHRWC